MCTLLNYVLNMMIHSKIKLPKIIVRCNFKGELKHLNKHCHYIRTNLLEYILNNFLHLDIIDYWVCFMFGQ